MRYYILLLTFLTSLAFAGEISTGWYGSIAIQGYDSTAYHGKQGTATKGDKTYIHEWKGAKWRFATEQQRNKFAENPEQYAPQYGGHCANAMSLNKKVDSNAKIWTIIDDKLYLFAGKKGLKRWQASDDVSAFIEEANKNWQSLRIQ